MFKMYKRFLSQAYSNVIRQEKAIKRLELNNNNDNINNNNNN